MDWLRIPAVSVVLIAGASAVFAPQAKAQTLVWQDNFDGSSIDSSKWTYEVGNGCQIGLCGWGNSELQYYTSRSENARVENGNLIIEARREDFEGSPFTSSRLKTEGRMHFKYGTLEARIKTPQVGNGLWPAYWMLGTIGVWPARGEIDLLEAGSASAIADGVANRRIGAAVHWDYNGSQADFDDDYTHPSDLSEDFHVYRMTWDADYIRVSIDGQQYFEFAISDIEGASLHEFHQQQYLLLNLAVGGTYTGVTSAEAVTAPLPGKMEVDYIRLYQNAGSELYVGDENAVPAGKFGVFTERTDTVGKANFGQDAELYLWNNLSAISATPYEGSEVMAYRASAGSWYGLGITTDYRDLGAYADGALKLRLKTTTPSTFKIGINTSFGDSWVDFVDGGEQYGLVRDGAWHEVSIPFSAFYDLDLHAVKQLFMVVADPPAADVEIAIDDVYYESGSNGGGDTGGGDTGGGDDGGDTGGGGDAWSTRIEAENYAAMSGIALESGSEGGQNVGWIDAGDWVVWDVNLPVAGTYKVEYRVAGLNGGRIQLEKAGGSPVYGALDVPVTGDWQSWQTISHTVTLEAGQQQIAVYAPAGGYNLDWVQFTQQ